MRQRTEPTKFNDYVALINQLVDNQPCNYQKYAHHQVWEDVMVDEYTSRMQNDVWEVLPRPIDRVVVGLQWIYKVKYNAEVHGKVVFSEEGN